MFFGFGSRAPSHISLTPRNWDLARIATVAEISASLGVIISVIYLGIQIQGSNKQLRAQS